ncbi:PAS domain S-box protein, partial [Halorubrum vacuolatum]
DGDERLLDVTITPVVENGEVRTLRGAGHDITDRKARREELEQYETIIEALTDAVYVLDENGRFTYINDEFVELTGYDRETILGSTPSLIKDDDAVEEAEHRLGQLLSHQGPETVTFEVTIQPRDGEPIACADHMGVLPYEGEEFEGSVGTLRDITDRKEREQKLKRQHEIIKHSSNFFLILNADGAVTYQSPVPNSLLEFEPQNLVDESASKYVHPEDIELLQSDLEHLLQHPDELVVSEYRLRTQDGQWRWFENRAQNKLDNPLIEGILVSARDITNRKTREQEIQDLNERLELAIDGANLGVWDWDMRTDDVELNDNWATMLGYEPDEIGSHIDEWEHRVHPDDREFAENTLNEHIAGETEYYDTEHRMRAADGRWKWIRDVGKIFECDEDGNPTRAVGIHIDINERKTSRALEEERDMFAEGPAVVFKWREAEGWPIEYVSDNVEKVFGYESDVFETGEIRSVELIHEEDRERVAREVESNSDPETDRFSHDPYRVVTADDDVRWVLDHTKNIRENGEITHRLGYLVDITEHKQRESELQRQ